MRPTGQLLRSPPTRQISLDHPAMTQWGAPTMVMLFYTPKFGILTWTSQTIEGHASNSARDLMDPTPMCRGLRPRAARAGLGEGSAGQWKRGDVPKGAAALCPPRPSGHTCLLQRKPDICPAKALLSAGGGGLRCFRADRQGGGALGQARWHPRPCVWTWKSRGPAQVQVAQWPLGSCGQRPSQEAAFEWSSCSRSLASLPLALQGAECW